MVERVRGEDASLGELTKPESQKASFHAADGMLKMGRAEMDEKLKQEECNMMFREEWGIHNKEKKQLEDNMQKTHALIFKNYCSQSMKTRIEEKDNFDAKV